MQARGEHPAAAAIKLGVTPALASMGLEGFSLAPADDPDLVREVLRRYVDRQLIGAERLIDVGLGVLESFDDGADDTRPSGRRLC